MDDRGTTTKTYGKKQSVFAYVLFTLMFIVGGAGLAFFYHSVQSATGSSPAATFTPFLSSPLKVSGGKCEIIPDAEDFVSCKNEYSKIEDDQVLRCPSGYGNIRVTKVRDGRTFEKLPRDMALLRHACYEMDSCKVNLADLRAADDGEALDVPTPIDEEVIIEPEEIAEDIAGIDSNGRVLMKHYSHHHHEGQVRVYYECDKIEPLPFSFIESIFDDMILEPETGTEEIATEESPIFLSKAHKCKTKLKNVAQDWDAGSVCGTSQQPMTLSCDPTRTGARIFVLSVKSTAQGASQGSDSGAVIEDTTSSVENEPFLAKHGGHRHKHGHKKEGKQWGGQLTDVCATQTGDCTTTLENDLNLSATNPLIDETTSFHVKYLCSYEH